MSLQKTIQRKRAAVEEAKSLLRKYKVVAIADLEKVRAAQLQEIRKKLKGLAYIKVFKNSVMKIAVSECPERENIKELIPHLQGSNIFLFTDMNPFKLKIFLDKNKVRSFAKAGDIAPEDIVVPAGNTGMPPGPIISQLNAVGLPTRIESGSVWISKETVVARKGEVIDLNLAAVLSKLGIKAVELGLNLKAAYDDGLILSKEDLEIDLDKIRADFEEAYRSAFTLSVEAAFPTRENISTLIQLAYLDAYRLSVNAAIFTPETLPEIIRKAYTEALYLNDLISKKSE